MAQTNTSLPASENTIGATPAPRGAKAQNGFQEPAAGNTGPTHSPALPSGHSKVQNKIPADPPQARSKAIFDGDPAIVRDGRAEAFAVFEEARGACNTRLDVLLGHLGEIDNAINEVARALRISQPPMDGKIDIRWWRLGGRRVPVFVRWAYKGGKSRAEMMKAPRKIGSHGTFRLNHGRTVELIQLGSLLMKRRAELYETVKRVRRALTTVRNDAFWIHERSEQAIRLRLECLAALQEAGYQLTPDVFE